LGNGGRVISTGAQGTHSWHRGENIMGDAAEDRAKADQLPEGDVIRVLLQQHARIRELFADVKAATGEHKEQAFDELRALLAVHETAEEMVLRPVSEDVAPEGVAQARNKEEEEAAKVLSKLEKLDCASTEFDSLLAQFERSVSHHAEQEESQEFPAILSGCDADRRQTLGTRILIAEKIAPTHPHELAAGSTAALWVLGPFASIVDRARYALSGTGRD
jgi:hemerythrin superfamily protein